MVKKFFTIGLLSIVCLLTGLVTLGHADTLEAGTLVVSKTFFGTTQYDKFQGFSVLTNIDGAACDAALPSVISATQSDEVADAARVGLTSWVPASTAFCVKSTYEIPPGTITQQGVVCSAVRDTTMTILEQLALCTASP